MATNHDEYIARRLAAARKFKTAPPSPEKLMTYSNACLGIRKPRILDAIRINSLPVVRALVTTRLDADWQLHRGGTTSPLMLATQLRAHAIIEFLLEKGACPTKLHRTLDFEHSPLNMAIQLRDAQTVALMLAHDCDVERPAYKSEGGFEYSGKERLADHEALMAEVITHSEARSIRQTCRQGGNASSPRRL